MINTAVVRAAMVSVTTGPRQATVLSLFFLAGMLATRTGDAADSIAIREIGSFYAGGEAVHLEGAPPRPRVRRQGMPAESVEVDGDFVHGQVYVQFVRLARPKHPPLLMWPGGSLTGVTFESTPDGREGWQMNFLRAGYSVYITDASQGGRAPWTRFPEIAPEEPLFRDAAFLWEVFRIGPPGSYHATAERRSAYADTRFPVSAFEQLARQAVPRFRLDPALLAKAHAEVVERVCPCILLTHSASGPLGHEAAKRRPDLIRALISVEPSGGIALDPVETARLARVPQLILWADHLDEPVSRETWQPLYQSTREYATRLRAAGAKVEWIDLPEQGIRGNSHLPMMDDNSAEIARLIDRWIRRNVR